MRSFALFACLLAVSCAAPALEAPPAAGTSDAAPVAPPSTPPPPIPPPPPDAAAWLRGPDPALQRTGDARLDAWIEHALAEGGPAWRPYLLRAFRGVRSNPRIVAANQGLRRPQDAQEWVRLIVTPQRIAAGQRLYRQFGSIASTSADPVPMEIKLAIWGAETDYGARPPEFDMIETIANLGAAGRGRYWHAWDIFAATAILATSGLPRERLRAYPDGTIGQTSWWPTTWERWAFDNDGDGRRDIWASQADILGSLGRVLHDWERGELAIVPVAPPDPNRPADQRRIRGGALIAAGADGPWFQQTRNFSLIYYTHDVMRDRPEPEREGYALAIALLAEHIAGRPPALR